MWDWIKRTWKAIPRKVKYVTGTVACYIAARQVGADPEVCSVILGGGGTLVGTHTITDLIAIIRGLTK